MDRETNTKNLAPKERVLDHLAFLFEQGEQGCAALSFVNNVILIADNSLSNNSGQDSKKQTLISHSMTYFSELANSSLSSTDPVSSSLLEARKHVFAEICKHIHVKYRSVIPEEKFLKWTSKILERSSNLELKKNKSNLGPGMQKDIYELAGYFIKIERFIQDNKSHGITSALAAGCLDEIKTDKFGAIAYKDYMVMHDEKQSPGYFMLKVDGPGVHAESRIIHYLLMTDKLQKSKKEEIYIGVSKLCCYKCELGIQAVNELMGTEGGHIKTRGRHGLNFEKKDKNLTTLPGFLDKDSFLITIGKEVTDITWQGYYYANGIESEYALWNREDILNTYNEYGNLHLYLDHKLADEIRSAYERLSQEYLPNTVENKGQRINMHDYSSSSPQHSTNSEDASNKNETEIPQKLFTELEAGNLNKEHCDFLQLAIKIFGSGQPIPPVIKEVLASAIEGKLNDYNFQEIQTIIEKTQQKKPILPQSAIKTKQFRENNAFNQYNNFNYKYEDTDIKHIGNNIIASLNNPRIKFTGPLPQNLTQELVNTLLVPHKELLDNGSIDKILGIYNPDSNHWITFIVVKENDQYLIYCKDSLKKEYSKFSENMKNCFGEKITILYSTQPREQLEEPEKIHCGVFALENMHILAQLDHKLNEDSFNQIQFFTPGPWEKQTEYNEKIKEKRMHFSAKYVDQVYMETPENIKKLREDDTKRAYIEQHDNEVEALGLFIQAKCEESSEKNTLLNSIDINNIQVTIKLKENSFGYHYHIQYPIEYTEFMEGIFGEITVNSADASKNSDAAIMIEVSDIQSAKDSFSLKNLLLLIKQNKQCTENIPTLLDKITEDDKKQNFLNTLDIENIEFTSDLSLLVNELSCKEAKNCLSLYIERIQHGQPVLNLPFSIEEQGSLAETIQDFIAAKIMGSGILIFYDNGSYSVNFSEKENLETFTKFFELETSFKGENTLKNLSLSLSPEDLERIQEKIAFVSSQQLNLT